MANEPRETADFIDALSLNSDRAVRETADFIDSLYLNGDSSVRDTAEFIDALYLIGPPAIEARCTSLGVTIFWRETSPPAAATPILCPDVQGAPVLVKPQGSHGTALVQGSHGTAKPGNSEC